MPDQSKTDLVGEAFRIDVPEIDCWVRFDSRCEYRGVVTTSYKGERSIVLREYDERVLLHEVLHRIIQTAPPEQRPGEWPENIEPEEQLVQRLERGLWAMGWRLVTEPAQPEEACGAIFTWENFDVRCSRPVGHEGPHVAEPND